MNHISNQRLLGNRVQTIWPAILSLIGVSIYGVSLRGRYFQDDYLFYFDPPPPSIFYYFTHPHLTGFYRPIQATFLAIVQHFYGLETLPIHLLQLALHILLVYLLYRWMLANGMGTQAAVIASLLLMVSQAATEAVVGNDTLSQVACALFGWSSLWKLSSALQATNRATVFRNAATGLALFEAALLSKESAAAFLLMSAALCLGYAIRQRTAAVRAAGLLIGCLIAFGVYWVLRSHVGASNARFDANNRYGFHLGMNVPFNTFQLLLAAILPLPTPLLFVATARHDLPLVAFALMTVLLVTLAIVVGFLRSSRSVQQSCLLLLCAALLGLVPTLFLNKVSELYVYNALPPLAALCGIELARLRNTTRKPRIATLLIGLLIAVNAFGALTKAHMMAENGRKEDELLAHIISFRSQLRPGESLILVNPKPSGPNYSVLIEHDFSLLQDSEPRIAYLMGLPRDGVRIVNPGDPEPLISGNRLELTVSPDTTDVISLPRHNFLH